METAEALSRLAAARSGHLATIRPDGLPHVVVVTFAVTADSVVTAIDHKPKSTRWLQRLRNISAHPVAAFLVDHYDDDWTRLWWVRVDGPATIHESGDIHADAIAALAGKYPQYREIQPEGPVIAVALADVTSWSHTP